jgi:hypothetical protein
MIARRIKYPGACLFWIVFGCFLFSVPVCAATRGIVVQTQTSPGSPQQIRLYSGYHALVVGCSNYRAGWPRLPHPVDDAREVAITLKNMGWEVELLEDPDWDNLDASLSRLITGPGKVRDKGILFWFSGHGHTLEEADGTKLGYIIPVDAPRPNRDETRFMRRAIDMRQIETVAKRIRAKHVLMVFDSCFSGAIFTMVRAAPSEYIEEKIAAPVREFITAGRENEQVPDRSVFKTCFIQGIKDGYADLNRDNYVTGEELEAYLEENVINYSRGAQHPQFGKINNPKLDKGDFVFVLKHPIQLAQSSAMTSELEAEKKRLAEETARVEQERRALEQMKALIEQRKQIEVERRRLENEKKSLTENKRKKSETQTPGGEKPKLAYIPKQTQSTKVALRKEPMELTDRKIKNMLLKYHFFDGDLHPFGSFANHFLVNQDDTITDHATNLIWQKSGSSRAVSWREAISYVKKLNQERFAGYSDWRLPTIEELASLLTETRQHGLHINSVFDSRQKTCWSADSISPHQYVSGTATGHFSQLAWIINFVKGRITYARWARTKGPWGVRAKDHYNYIRAVRSAN